MKRIKTWLGLSLLLFTTIIFAADKTKINAQTNLSYLAEKTNQLMRQFHYNPAELKHPA